MLEGRPDRRDADAALAAFGVAADGLARPDAIELWPEHAVPVMVFAVGRQQWRCGPGGVVGLDLGALEALARGLHVGRRAWRAALPALLAIEAEALRWFGEQRARG